MTQSWDSLTLGHTGTETLGDIPLGLGNQLRPDWDQVDQLHRVITRGPTQQTVAVTGGWGSGKTSLMRLVQERLTEAQIPTVWFNAWRYEREPELVVPLLLTIEHDLRRAKWLGDSRLTTAGQRLRTLSVALLRGLTFRSGAIDFSGKDAVDFIGSQNGGAETDASRYFGFVTKLEEMITELGDGDEHFRIVIFVDDLDRCQGPTMFSLMESMKLFFDVPGVVFVAGVAIAPLRQAVSEHYGEDIDTERVTRADLYVEKIFPTQIRVSVPLDPILDRYASETGCLFLAEQQSIYTALDGMSSGGFYYRAWLMWFFDHWGLESPRVVKMWLDALDHFTHRYVLLRKQTHMGSESSKEEEESFPVPEMAWAIEGLVILAGELEGGGPTDQDGRWGLTLDRRAELFGHPTVSGFRTLLTEIERKFPADFQHYVKRDFGKAYSSFAQPSTLLIQAKRDPGSFEVSTQPPIRPRVIRP